MKLPELKGGMPLDQAMLIELLSLLVEEGVITEEKAVARYNMRKQQFDKFGNRWI